MTEQKHKKHTRRTTKSHGSHKAHVKHTVDSGGTGHDNTTETIKIVDLYTAFKAAYHALQEGRYKLFIQAKEHFLAKEYHLAHDKFKQILDNLVQEADEAHPGGKSIKTAESLVGHLHHDLLRRLKLEKKRQHINFVNNEVNLLDQCLYPAKVKSESQIRTLLDT